MKTVLVTPEVAEETMSPWNRGTGDATWHLAKLLRGAGHDVHIVFTHAPEGEARGAWQARYDALGVVFHWVHANPLTMPPGYNWHLRVSEVAAELIPTDADVVYFVDWDAAGVHFLRRRRFASDGGPAVINLLHGGTTWAREGLWQQPTYTDDLWLDYSERYVAAHSDYVVAPSRAMLAWVRERDWTLPPAERVRVLPMPYVPAEPSIAPPAPVAAAERFRRIIFFGRLETRRGIDLFANALAKLQGKPCLEGIAEVVLLGHSGPNIYGQPADIVKFLDLELNLRPAAKDDENPAAAKRSPRPGKGPRPQASTAAPRDDAAGAERDADTHRIGIRALADFTAESALAYLAEHAADALVVVPSRVDNGSYDLIRASRVPGLRLLATQAGAIPEMLGADAQGSLAEPFFAPFTRALEAALLVGPRGTPPIAVYDCDAANAGWLAFHEEMCAQARHRRSAAATQTATSTNARMADICVTHHNLGAYLPYLLDSLAGQTSQDFNLFVVDDGSTDPRSQAAFEKLSRQYARDGWRFAATANQGLSAARNHAAALGSADYLIFMDADNIAAPNMVERFLDGIRRSGDDALTSYVRQFSGEGGYDPSRAQPFLWAPGGASPLLGLFNNTFGDANGIVRRAAFEAVGGFTTDVSREITGEDWELLARLALAGYKLDVMPEYLVYYRYRKDSMLRTTDAYLNDARVLRHYEDRLRTIGLPGLATFAVGLNKRGFSADGSADMAYLVNQVSGYKIVKALRIKLRNQVARRLGRPLIVQ